MPYRTLENVIEGVVITFTDWSASKAMERTLREQAHQLRQMAEALPDRLWSCKADGSCDYLSAQWLPYTGVPLSELLGFGWLEQVHREDRERVRESWRAAVKAQTRFEAEFRIRSASRTYRWLRARSVPIQDSAGSVVKWYGANMDIDALKRAEQGAPAMVDGG